MKIQRQPALPGFHPFDLVITVETEEDCRLLRAIVNADQRIPVAVMNPNNQVWKIADNTVLDATGLKVQQFLRALGVQLPIPGA